ncbi:MAG: PilZ domain-containing protein [Terriglobales bacterium]
MGALPQLRRQSLRQPVHSLAYVNLSQGNGGVVLDLSETGVSLHSVKPLGRSKDPVNMEFLLLETGSRVQTQGEVVWADEAGKAGLHFVDLSRFARHRLQEWMLYNALSARDAAQEVVHQPRPQLTAAAFAAASGGTERAATPWELGIGREIPATIDLPDIVGRLAGKLAFRPGPVTSVLLASLLFAALVLQVSPTPMNGALLLLLGGVAPMSFWWLYRVAVALQRWR